MQHTYRHFALGSILLSATLLAACSLKKADEEAPPATPTSRSYSGTASVGDFLTVRLDTLASTMYYHNTTNGDDYTVSYTRGADGAYNFSDPSGNLVTGYEVPGFAMVIKANKAGPGKNTPALITAIQSTTVTTAVFKSKDYNYMQFRVNSGGMELGHVHCDANGNISPNGFWPYGAASGGSAFNNGTLPLTSVTPNADSSALLLTMDEGSGPETDYIFATPGGFLAVDTPNGAIVCMQQRTSQAFDAPTMAGSYNAILYSKNDATTGMGNVETAGSQEVMTGTLAISAGGAVTVTNNLGAAVVTNAALTPLGSTNLVGAGKLEDPCPGFFRFSDGNATSPRDVYLAFMTDAVLIASFTYNTSSGHYDYFYGVGLRGSPTGTAALSPAHQALALTTALK